jgi:hypothetical protein
MNNVPAGAIQISRDGVLPVAPTGININPAGQFMPTPMLYGPGAGQFMPTQPRNNAPAPGQFIPVPMQRNNAPMSGNNAPGTILAQDSQKGLGQFMDKPVDKSADKSATNVKLIATACAISAAVTIFVVIIFYYIAIDGNVKVPVPLAGQDKYVLTGAGTWMPLVLPTPTGPVQYLHVANTTSNGYPGGTPIPFQTIVASATNSITLDNPYTLFVLAVGKTYKLMGGVNFWRTRGGVYQWNVVVGAKKGYIGTGADGIDIASAAAIAYIAPTVPTSVSLYAVQDVNLANFNDTGLCAWATIDVLG